MNAATAAWRESNGAFHYVTLGGELLSRHGVYTGGSTNGNGDGKAPASILGRKNQIADLRATLAGLQEQVAEISRRKGALQSEQTELAGRPAAGADRAARPGSRHRHARRRVQRAAEFPAPAAPED